MDNVDLDSLNLGFLARTGSARCSQALAGRTPAPLHRGSAEPGQQAQHHPAPLPESRGSVMLPKDAASALKRTESAGDVPQRGLQPPGCKIP